MRRKEEATQARPRSCDAERGLEHRRTSSPSAKPFKFKSWELEAFKGDRRARAPDAAGTINEIILDFQNEILDDQKDIRGVGDAHLNVGDAAVVGGDIFVVDGIASARRRRLGQGLVDTGEVAGKGARMAGKDKGLSDTDGRSAAPRTPAASARAFRTPARSSARA